MMESFESLRNSLETLIKGLGHLYNAEEAKSVSKILLTELTGESWFELTQRLDQAIPASLQSNIQTAYNRLRKHEPIQYVLGKAHFYGRNFLVSPDVLIPRGETEELMVSIRDRIMKEGKDLTYIWKILDIGTGTGCIPISLKLELADLNRRSHISGLDVSLEALEVARDNANLYKVDIQFDQQDILKANKHAFDMLDIIVSNPPYIPQSESAEMHANVTEYEPELALFVPDNDPLVFYRKITLLAVNWLKPSGMLFFEIHEDMGNEMLKLFKKEYWESPTLQKDIHGKDRILMAKKKMSYTQ